MFAATAERALAGLPPGDAAIERLRLFGTSAAPGIARRVLDMEVERGGAIVERLLEYPLEGTFSFRTADGRTRDLTLRGKVDRVDLLSDGTFHLIDYKTRAVPDPRRALQLPIYSLCVTRQLAGYRGRQWQLGEASYLSYEGPAAVVPLVRKGETLAERLDEAQRQLFDVLDGIGAGHFPPQPAEQSLCSYCAFARCAARTTWSRPMADAQLPFAFDDAPAAPAAAEALTRDAEARDYAVNPAVHVALEASAGTGKTRVLVDRYLNLLALGIEPRRILAITFTRKAAAEMRARIVADLTRMGEQGRIPGGHLAELRGRLSEMAISTIDAFCLSLLGEFPLEADVDPGFAVADETETPRLIDEALDRALRIGRAQSAVDRRRRAAARAARRAAAAHRAHAPDRSAAGRCRRRSIGFWPARPAAPRPSTPQRWRWPGSSTSSAGPMAAWGASAPPARTPASSACSGPGCRPCSRPGIAADPGEVADLAGRLRDHFLTQGGAPRKRPNELKASFPSATAYTAHTALVGDLGPAVADWLQVHRADVNVVLARSLRWMLARALEQYARTLDEHAAVDFTGALVKALALLAQMEEFSQSRYRLESRYQHVLVDELQDTSRAQWQLVELLVRAWGEGAGLAHEGPAPPSIFVVGDRKQSIYGFRDAEVGVLDEAARLIGRLTPGREPRRAIVRSFRAVPALQQFVNDVCEAIDKRADRDDAFRYSELDRFPVQALAARSRPVGLVAAADTAGCARAVAAEVARLLREGETVRDRQTGVPRAVAPGDIAILFRSRDSHREYERELEQAGVPFYVYKGLGFFDADEVKDVMALIQCLAEPDTHLHVAAFLRLRFVRLSDVALKRLAPRLADALGGAEEPAASPICRTRIGRCCGWPAPRSRAGGRWPIDCRRPNWSTR